MTYGRRYLFSALIGVAADDDTDADPEPGATYTSKAPRASVAPKPAPAPKVETQQFRTTAPTGELPPDEQDRQYLAATAAGCGWTNPEVAATIQSAYKKSKLSELTRAEFNDLVTHIQANLRHKGSVG
jgi:hypothetical protein